MLNDSDELFQRILRVSVKIRPARDNYAASNDVTGYEMVGSATPPARAQAPAANTGGSKAAPWQKKAA